MALTLMTNEIALTAQRTLNDTNDRLHKTLQRVSSGSRIVQASDDAAGLAISDQINAEVRSINQGMRNAQDGISLVQIYEGGTNEINNLLMRIRELAMQSASDTVGDKERLLIDNEVQQVKQEIDRIAQTTQFTGKKLLTGEAVKLEFQVGSHNDPNVDRILYDPGSTDLTASGLGVDGVHVRDKETAQDVLEVSDKAIFKVNEARARVGSAQSRLQTTINAQGIFRENLMAAKSRIRDADLALESANMARDIILRKAGVSVLTQANETPAILLNLIRG